MKTKGLRESHGRLGGKFQISTGWFTCWLLVLKLKYANCLLSGLKTEAGMELRALLCDQREDLNHGPYRFVN